LIGKKHIPQYKIDEVNYLVDLFRQHKTVAVINVAKLNDKQIQYTKRALRGKATFRMSKKNLQLRAIEAYKNESKKENLDELAKFIPGQSSLLFTNMNIFELKKVFIENKWKIPAKPNEITPVDIWVPAGDTGLPPGQVISELNMILKLPTRIQNDTIWIREDTRTHKAGDFIEVKQAAALKKLGINPIESILKISYAWSDGEIIPEEVLYMDMEQFKLDVASCYLSAQKLAIELGILDSETIKPLVQKAFREAMSLLFELPIFLDDMLPEYIKKAETNARILNSMVLGEGISSTTKEAKVEIEDKKKKKKEEKEKEEPTGIGSLF
jgi:large subunit ribosomal protein L10